MADVSAAALAAAIDAVPCTCDRSPGCWGITHRQWCARMCMNPEQLQRVLEAAAPVIARDALLSLAADLDWSADCSVPHSPAAGAYRHAARMARERAGQGHTATEKAVPAPGDARQAAPRSVDPGALDELHAPAREGRGETDSP